MTGRLSFGSRPGGKSNGAAGVGTGLASFTGRGLGTGLASFVGRGLGAETTAGGGVFSVITIVIGGAEGVSVTATGAGAGVGAGAGAGAGAGGTCGLSTAATGAGMGTGLGSVASTEGAWPAIERGLVDTACVDSGGGGCDGVDVKLSAVDDVAG